MSALVPTVLAGGVLLAAGAGFVAGRLSTRRERAAAGRELAAARRAATRDALTGLRNRAGLLDELARWAAGREPYGVLLVDLDGFKAVNDCHGHAAGDVVLVEVAKRLTVLVGDAGTVARLGGDEFVLIATSPTAVISRLLGYDAARAVARPVVVDGRRVEVRASVGVVQALPGDDTSALLRSADIAMYRAKTGQGQAGVAEFDAVLSLAGVVDTRPGARLRELTRFGYDLAVTR